MESLAQARKNQTVDYSEVLPEIGCFGFRREKAGGSRLRLSQVQTMQIENSASRQRGKTVRIVTDFPVLVQTEKTLTRKGKSKPVSVLLGGYLISLCLTDSGEPVLRIDEPP